MSSGAGDVSLAVIPVAVAAAAGASTVKKNSACSLQDALFYGIFGSTGALGAAGCGVAAASDDPNANFYKAAGAVVLIAGVLGIALTRKASVVTQRILAESSRQITALQEILVGTKKLDAALATQGVTWHDEADKVGVQTKALGAVASDVKSSADALTEQNKQLQARITSLEALAGTQAAQIVQFKGAIKAFEERLAQAQTTHADVQKGIVQLSGEIETYVKQKADQSASSEATQVGITNALSALKTRADASNTLFQSISQELAQKREALQKVDQDLGSSAAAFSQVVLDVGKEREQFKTLQESHAKLEAELASLRESYTDLLTKFQSEKQRAEEERAKWADMLQKGQALETSFQQTGAQIRGASAPVLAAVEQLQKSIDGKVAETAVEIARIEAL